jgi:hypothetical protein
MKLLRTPHFERNYAKAPQQVQRAFDKQSLLLLQNLRHPSLRAKKYDESRASGRRVSIRIGASTSKSGTTRT